MHLKTLLQKQHIFIYLFSFFFSILIFMVLFSKILLIKLCLLSEIVLTDFTFRPVGFDIIFRRLSCLNISSVTSSSDSTSKQRKKVHRIHLIKVETTEKYMESEPDN